MYVNQYKDNTGLVVNDIRILCVISTTNREPFISILRDGAIESWARDVQKIQVCTLEASFNSKPIILFDKLREKLRYKSIFHARLGQILDLMLLPFLNFVPKMQLSEKSQEIPRYFVRIPEMLSLYRWKYIAMLKFFIESTDCDFIYTVNSSCFVNENLFLKKLVDAQPIEYAGTLIPDPKFGYAFVGGSNRVISRNSAALILKNMHRWPVYVLEDVGLGRLMRRLKIRIVSIESKNLTTIEELDQLKDDAFTRYSHFRLRSYVPNKCGHEVRNDVAIFRSLSSRLSQLNNRG
jgi:hypothetical protein